MRKLLIPAFFILTCSLIPAQTIKMEVNTDTSETENFGPNQANYMHYYFGIGILPMTGQAGGLIMPFSSSDLVTGILYKRKWSEVFSSGFGVAYHNQSFRLQQTTNKVLPDTILNEKESLLASSLQAEIYQRFNFGKRGDIIGAFLDLGAGANFFVRMQHETVNTNSNGVVVTVNEKKLLYNQKNYFHLLARLGYNRWILYAQYRLNPLISLSSGLPKLPPLSIGIQIGFY